MDASEYDLDYFQRAGFRRRTCPGCGQAFWSVGDRDRCGEVPCQPIAFVGQPLFSRPYDDRTMRETFLRFFEQRGHTRLRRYPTVARWRNDVFFTQASIYDFQPWVTSGAIPPPANPLVLSQPVLRFIDLEEVGVSARHLTLFEMLAHHAFNRPDHEVYFKDRCVELCHEFLTSELGADPKSITYKEEVWEGGGNLGPSLSVGAGGLEIATLVFMEYTRDGNATKPMPLTVVDTGYGLERLVWTSQGTATVYEAAFGPVYRELVPLFSARDAAVLVDHARALNFLLTDGVVPSNSKAGYFARLLLRRAQRLVATRPDGPDLLALLDRTGREIAHDFPEVGEHRDDLHAVVRAELERFDEALARARPILKRHEEKVTAEGGRVEGADLLRWYDSLGIPPELAVAELAKPPPIPDGFYAEVAKLHESERPATEYVEETAGLPEVPATVRPTEVLYYLDPYTLAFEAHVVHASGPYVVLDRTYFYPTGGGQLADRGHLAELEVVDVVRAGPWVFHRLERPAKFHEGERVRGTIDAARRLQLMQHHTATHLLNGALREVLGPHVWQAGAYKAPDVARIDVTHYRPLSPEELRRVERRVNAIVREDRPVKSYFEARTEAERRFGFTLYQGGAVPGRELRIVEIPGFDVEACGGTHCTHTSEVGAVAVLGVDRIQDGVVRLTFASGDRALELREEHEAILKETAQRLGVPVDRIPDGVNRLLNEVAELHHAARDERTGKLETLAEELLRDPARTETVGVTTIVTARVPLDRSGLMELSRLLGKSPGRVAILAGEEAGRGTLFVGSTAEGVSAGEVVEAVKASFAGKGGGNRSAATAVGEPGAPLETALGEARERVRRAASA